VSVSERLAGLDGIGIGPEGVVRLAWTAEDAACREWFSAQASGAGLTVRVDPAGNMWAVPDSPPPWFGVGSHLDSVRGGGRFDGPLGVACGFELAAIADERSVAVVSFADEEGARFNTPTFGSKALAGRLDLPAVLERRDVDGVALGDAMRSFGVDPDRIGDAPPWLEALSGFLEIHIDQSTDVARAEVPVGIVSSLANRMRLEVSVEGRADHAGTTPRTEREDALLAAARLIVAADELGAELGVTVTTSRLLVEPNAPTTIASRVRLWIDARSVDDARLDEFLHQVEGGAHTQVAVASRSTGHSFSAELRERLGRAGRDVLGATPPEVVCFAGHDAGVIGERVPAAMVLVRNRTGVSHSPAEHVELEDADEAVRVAARMLK
jgi:N-carbamoyl-L-amino-acid hydrolase